MKINFILLCIVIMLGFGWTIFSNQAPPQHSEQKAAQNFTAAGLNNKTISLADFKGQEIYLHFWASWCAPCLVEFPEIIHFAQQNKDVIILTLAVQDKPENIEKFLQKIKKDLPANFHIALDPEWNIAKDIYNVRKLPETFLISDEQNIKKRFVGAQDNWDKMNLLQ